MEKSSEKNQRLAKNTLVLYFRMMLLMCVNLYVSRVVLKALGVEDFGVYNVIGGFVVMFGVVSGGLSHAVSRFLNIEMGKNGNVDSLKRIFSTAAWIHIFFALAILVVAEMIGPWFIDHKMVMSVERLESAKFVFHTSLLAFLINLISVPYNAVIISHEHMNIYAYVSVLEGLLKLVLSISLVFFKSDKLVVYGIMMLLIAVVIRVIYQLYCRIKYEEAKIALIFDRKLVREMFFFSGWNMIGSSSVVLSNHGVNILLNIFCSPIVNAARGIAMQVSFAITQFAQNFVTALNPQIMKSFGEQNFDRYKMLILKGAKFSAIMLTLLALPIFFEAKQILSLWLGDVPEYSVNFVRLILIFAVSESFTTPFVVGIMATGKIKWLQILVGGSRMLNFPISFVLLKYLGYPEIVFVVAILISQMTLLIEGLLLKGIVEFDFISFYFKSVVRLVASILPCILLFLMISSVFEENLLRMVVVVILESVLFLSVMWLFVLERDDRIVAKSFMSRLLGKIKR